MWIRTQNKQRIINSDQIIDIAINKIGKKIYAATTRDDDFFELGEYKDRDACVRVMDILTAAIGDKRCQWIYMPEGDDVVGWSKDIQESLGLYC